MFLAFNCHFPYEKGDKQYGKREKNISLLKKLLWVRTRREII